MRDFRTWYTADINATQPTLPTGSAFLPALKRFHADPANFQFEKLVGLIDDQLKFATVRFTSSLVLLEPSTVSEEVYDTAERLVGDVRADMPGPLKAVMQSAHFTWGWMRTELALVSNMFTGLAISFPVAFLVLLIATRNYILSMLACVSIGCIVTSVLGLVRYAYGWDLGVAESIAAVIVVGFSVDYTVHLAHMYEEGPLPDRDSRFRHAAVKMGVTVIGGAFTTFGAGAFMFACIMTFFTKMAVLICFTIVFSLMYSLLFFMGILAVAGPQGHTGSVMPAVNFVRNLLLCKKATAAEGGKRRGSDGSAASIQVKPREAGTV